MNTEDNQRLLNEAKERTNKMNEKPITDADRLEALEKHLRSGGDIIPPAGGVESWEAIIGRRGDLKVIAEGDTFTECLTDLVRSQKEG